MAQHKPPDDAVPRIARASAGPPPDLNERYYTIAEAAEAFDLGANTIRRYMRDGKLKFYRVAGDRNVRIPESSIREFLAVTLEPHETMYTVKDVAERLRLSTATVRKLLYTGRLRHIRSPKGRTPLIPESAILELMKPGSTPA